MTSEPTQDDKPLQRALKQHMTIRGLRPQALSVAAGLKPGAVRDLMRKDTANPSIKTMGALAGYLGTTIEMLRSGIVGASDAPLPSAPIGNLRSAADVQVPTFGALPRDLPVWGSVEGGPEGCFELLTASTLGHTDLIRRPIGLAGLRDAFAMYVVGDSMSPWREPGELVYVNPNRQPAPGAYVMVVFHPTDESGPRKAMVKKLIRRSPSYLELEQYNPMETFKLPMAQVESIYRIMSNDEVNGNS